MLHSKAVIFSVLGLFCCTAHELWLNLNRRWVCARSVALMIASPTTWNSFFFLCVAFLNFTSKRLDGGILPSFHLSIPPSLILPARMTLSVNYGISCHPTVCSHPAWYCNNRNNTTGWITWSEGGCLREAGGGGDGGGGGGGVERCFLKAPLP